MSRKRAIPDVYKHKKKVCTVPPSVLMTSSSSSTWADEPLLQPESKLPSDTKVALLYIKQLFPVEKFNERVPPMIMKHQLYSVLHNRTTADKELEDLRSSGEIKLFKLGADAGDFCILFTTDYTRHVLKATADIDINKHVIDKFLSTVVAKCNNISLDKRTIMEEFHFKDEEITELVKASVLTVRDMGSWWLAVPGAGIFMRSYLRGRKSILTMIRKSKYKEILKAELEVRKLPKIAALGMQYHIHDIIGSDSVECIQTTSGQMLRLNET